MTVYLDLVVLLNFLVDFLLLLGTNRMLGFRGQALRCALGAALGGVYAGACMLHGFRFLGNAFWRFCVLGLMALCAFGLDKSAWKKSGAFLLLSMALGGIAVCFGRRDVPALVLAAGGIWLLCRLGGNGGGRVCVPLSLTYGGKTVAMTALRDSGNGLRDPITGEPVFVIGAEAARELTGLTKSQLSSPLETLAARPVPGLRLIPYRAVGGGGMLLGLRMEEVTVDGRKGKAIVAFSGEEIGNGGGYQALVTA